MQVTSSCCVRSKEIVESIALIVDELNIGKRELYMLFLVNIMKLEV